MDAHVDLEADVVCVGGSAGALETALELVKGGASVVLLGDRRASESAGAATDALLGNDARRARALAELGSCASFRHCPEARVWGAFVGPPFRVGFLDGERGRVARGGYLVLSEASVEYRMPLPRACEALLRSREDVTLAPRGSLDPVVVAGASRAVLAAAYELVAAGVRVSCVIDAAVEVDDEAPSGRWTQTLLAELSRHDVPLRRGCAVVGAETVAHRTVLQLARVSPDGTLRPDGSLPCGSLVIADAWTPRWRLASSLGCRMTYSDDHLGWIPDSDGFGQTSVGGVFAVAGNGGDREGDPSPCSAAGAILVGIGLPVPGSRREPASTDPRPPASRVRPATRSARAFQALVARAEALDDDAVMCPCDGTTVADLRHLLREGVRDLDGLKRATGYASGACGGDRCETTAVLLACGRDRDPRTLSCLRQRPPVFPVELDSLLSTVRT